MICPNCGAVIESGYRFVTCPDCGRTFDSTQLNNKDILEPKLKPLSESEPVTMSEPDSSPVIESEPFTTPEFALESENEPIIDLSLSSNSEPTLEQILVPKDKTETEPIPAPEPSSVPEPLPESASVPEPETAPVPVPKPEQTLRSESTSVPEQTPVVEPAPATESTPTQEPTDEPVQTLDPKPTSVPEQTPVAEPAPAAESTPTQEPTDEPVQTLNPEPTLVPEPTPVPEPTLDPKPTPAPELTPASVPAVMTESTPIPDSEKIPVSSGVFRNKKFWIIAAILSICFIGAIVFAIIWFIGSDDSSSTLMHKNNRIVGSSSFNEQSVLDKLYIDEYELDDQYVVVLQNNSSHTIDLTGEASFYDRNGNDIDVGRFTEQHIYSLGPGQQECMIFETEASYYNADVDLSVEESDSNYEPVDFSLEDFEAYTDGTLAFKIKNRGERVRDPIIVKFLFYKDGKLIDTVQSLYKVPFNADETLPNTAELKIDNYDRYESYIGRYWHSGKTGQSSTFDPSKINNYLKTKEYMPTKQFLIVSVENVSSYNLDVYGTIATYLSDGSLRNSYDDMIRALAPGQKYLLYFHIDEDYNRKDFHLSIGENQEETSLSSDLKIKNIEQLSSKITFDLENTGNVDAKNVEVVFLFLNGDTLVNLDSTGPDDYSLRAGETASLEMEIPEGDSEKIEWYICGYDNELSML